jgi:hypothetical protein
LSMDKPFPMQVRMEQPIFTLTVIIEGAAEKVFTFIKTLKLI